MNCANHPDVAAAAFCRTCGKALCASCERGVRGVVYCEDCLATRLDGGVQEKPAPTCANHPGVAAAAFCRTCGKPLCSNCERDVRSVVYCEDCLASRVQGTVPPGVSQAPRGLRPSAPNPTLAGILAAVLPFGVGQAYNGQYTRGVVHLAIFSFLIWGVSSFESSAVAPVFGIGIAAFYFYQIIDAVRSARFLAAGQPAPDPFGLDNVLSRNQMRTVPTVDFAPASPAAGPPSASYVPAETDTRAASDMSASNVPTTAIILIGLGVVFFFAHSGLLGRFWIGSAWPLVFIVIGAALLVKRWEAITTRRCCLMGPAVLLTLGVLFLAQSIGHIGFSRSFPLLLIVIGLVLFWQRTAPPPAPPQTPPVVAPEARAGDAPQLDSSGNATTTNEPGKVR